MPKIKITPEDLEAQATQLENLKRDHDVVYGKIKTLVNSLANDIWQGEANAAFTNSFKTNDKNFKKFADDVADFSRRMKLAAREMRNTEASIKNQMK